MVLYQPDGDVQQRVLPGIDEARTPSAVVREVEALRRPTPYTTGHNGLSLAVDELPPHAEVRRVVVHDVDVEIVATLLSADAGAGADVVLWPRAAAARQGSSTATPSPTEGSTCARMSGNPGAHGGQSLAAHRLQW